MQKLILLMLVVVVASCAGKKDLATNNCRHNPNFIRSLSGFNPSRSFFSTSEIKTMGLVLGENAGTADRPQLRYYQHPSWRTGGWLAPIQIDREGNIFTAPAPFISVLDNPVKNQNTLFKVDTHTGVMEEFMRLPFPDSLTTNNPYGIIGLAYLCDVGVLYVSTILGSDRFAVRGGIYAIDIKSRQVIDKHLGIDAMGMGISSVTGTRKLYFGNGRNSSIYSVPLTSNGKFDGSEIVEFSLDGLGARGDDKVRRIRTDDSGNLTVYGIEFNYNLIAPREKQETVYNFNYNSENKSWQLAK